ncbi:MAG: hypothetical protein M3R63_12480 [Actinomycetota bacterium]|nr:hypothetical protein [Actinomycetota bacterium]
MFHQFHPQSLPGCPTGGADLCGLLARNDFYRWSTAGVLGLVAILFTAQAVFARAAEVTQFLSGTRWSKRRLLVFLQYRFRKRLVKRGYGSLDLSAGSDRVRPVNIRCRLRADRYPHGSPRKPHEDPPQPPRSVDVPLEPTFLGNVFAAMHQHILAVHGLRLQSCWTFLLMVLPDDKKANLLISSSVVLTKTQSVSWALMNCIWVVWIPGALWKIGWVCGWLAVAYFAYRGVRTAAGVYCDELRAIVVSYRFQLYERANFRLPKSIAEELQAGLDLSGYLDRKGPPPASVEFVQPPAATDSVQKWR